MEEDLLLTTDYGEVIQDVNLGKPAPERGSFIANTRSEDLAVGAGMNTNDAEAAIVDEDQMLISQVKDVSLAEARTPDQIFEDDLSNQLDLVQIQNRFADRIQKEKDYQDIGEFYIEQALLVDDPKYSADTVRWLTNQRIVQEGIAQSLEDSEGGWGSMIIDFLDYTAFEYLPHMIVGKLGAGGTEDKGEAVLLAASQKSPAEMKEWFDQYRAETSAEGLFTSDNMIATAINMDAAVNQGYDPQAPIEKVFGAMMLADIATLGTSLVTRAARATTAIGRVQALAGRNRATAAAANLVRNQQGQPITQPHFASSLGTSTFDWSAYTLRPSNGPITQAIGENEVIDALREIAMKGTHGRVITEAEIKAAADEINTGIANRTNHSIVDSRIFRDDVNSFIAQVFVGKSGNGDVFTDYADAVKVLEKLDNAKIVEAPERGGYLIKVEQRIDNLSPLPGLTAEDEGQWILAEMYNNILGSSGTLDDNLLFSQAALGEQAVGAIREKIVKPAQKIFGKLTPREAKEVTQLMREYRDGTLVHKSRPSMANVETEYHRIFGRAPSENWKAAWNKLVEVNDASWWLTAQTRLQSAVRSGHTMVDIGNGNFTRAFRVSKADLNNVTGDAVLDVATGRSVSVANAKGVIYKGTSKSGGHLYFTNVKNTRILYPDDVLPYNFGGPRTNPNHRFFVGGVDIEADAAGNFHTAGYKSVVGAFTEKEAIKAEKQLNAIGRGLQAAMTHAGIDDWKQLAQYPQVKAVVDRLIKKNNDWNPHITGLDDLIALSTRTKNDFSRVNNYARARNAPVKPDEAGFDTSVQTFDDIIEFKASGQRQAHILDTYGGGPTYNPDPVEAITKQFQSKALGFANQAYTNRAITAWVRLAEKSSAVSINGKFRKNEIWKKFINSTVDDITSANGKRLKQQKEIIMRRLHMNERTSTSYQLGEGLTRLIYGASFGSIKADMNSGSATGQLLKVGFYTKMGFFNVGQMLVQAAQVPVIIALSPAHGSKGASMALAMRPLAVLGKDASDLALKRIGQIYGYTTREMEDIAEFIRDSGRLNVDVEAAELQTGVDFSSGRGIRRMLGRGLDATAYPFREGERIGRLTSELTAILEYKARFPESALNSDAARAWIAKRDQDISFRMTAISRSKGQDGFMRVPTQWLTYTFRSFETLFTGKQFTKTERIMALIPLVLMYGMAGMGIKGSAEWAAEQFGLDPETDESTFMLLKYGVIDALIGDTAIAERIAPFAQTGDTIRKFTEGSFLEAIYGPSGGITGDTIEPIIRSIGSIVNGNYDLALFDWGLAARSISSVNNASLAYEMIKNGTYTNKRGIQMGKGFDEMDAALQVLGFPPESVLFLMEQQRSAAMTEKDLKDYTRMMETRWEAARQKLVSDDPAEREQGQRMANQIAGEITEGPLTESQKMQVRQAISNGLPNVLFDTIKKAIRNGEKYVVQRLAAQAEKGRQ